MASQNIAEWSPDQVAAWLTGLGPSVAQYVPSLKARGLNGAKLLTLRCDDLEYLGVTIIGHQELILEAVELLRNFHFEASRECVLRLALAVSAAAGAAAPARAPPSAPARLPTQALADVARALAAVKPLVSWLDRCLSVGTWWAASQRARLLRAALEAATSAQRDRFAEQPARAVRRAARALRAAADYIMQEVSDPVIVTPASLAAVWLRGAGAAGTSALGLRLSEGARQVLDVRFGSPAHRAAALMPGDEIVQVDSQVVVGWCGEEVLRACAGRDVVLLLRRRGARGPPQPGGEGPRREPRPAPRRAPRYVRPWELHDLMAFKREMGLLPPAARESSDSELSAPPSPPAPRARTRVYGARPRAAVPAPRRHSVCGGSPRAHRARAPIDQLWQELRNQKSLNHTGSAQIETDDQDEDSSPYRRDKASSYSTGLEISPRPKTCLGVALNHPIVTRLKAQIDEAEASLKEKTRGKLDKSHSTPAYDFDANDGLGSLVTQIIPESPTTPTDSPSILVHSAEKADQILDFKKSSSQIEEAILQISKKNSNGEEKTKFPFNEEAEVKDDDDEDTKVDKLLETINIAILEHQKDRPLRQSTYKSQVSSDSNQTIKSFSSHEHVKTIQNEIVQAINEQRLTSRPRPDTPPQPPPRPISTQKPIQEPPGPNLPGKDNRYKEYPVLKIVKQPDTPEAYNSPLKPLKHITKHDIQMIPTERREMPPLNSETNLNISQTDISKVGKKDAEVGLPQTGGASRPEHHNMSTSKTSLSPTAGVVRGIFPSSKMKSLKKKNSILAKGRNVPARTALCWAACSGALWQRVRGAGPGAGGGAATSPRWVPRHLLLVDTRLYAYRSLESTRADCLLHLSGCTVAMAPEVKSRAHAFKVYHTGSAFYFCAASREAAVAWEQLLHRATLQESGQSDDAKKFSETDYSDNDSDVENDKRSEHKEREKDKSKFNSLKKLTHRMHRSESQEMVGHSTSLDRKYLRFFSRSKNKEEKANKNKHVVTPVPTEHYRSYRRVPTSELSHHAEEKEKKRSDSTDSEDKSTRSNKMPKPINYIHASNPNLLDFEKSDFVAKPNQFPLPRPKVRKPDNFIGFVTLEEFMLKKQEEERQQVYTNRVLMGIERDKKEDRAISKKAAKELQKQLDKIVPDVIYGELPTYSDDQLPVPVVEQIQSRTLPKTPAKPMEHSDKNMKPVSIKGKDGYEKIVYTIGDKAVQNEEPPKIPPKPVYSDVARKCSLTTAKDLGYEVIYDDDSETLNRKRSSKDLGYETIYGDDDSKKSDESQDKATPPKVMPKSRQVLTRQSSLTSGTPRPSRPGVDTSPVFVQGESPEKFWLNSLRRNNRIISDGSATSAKSRNKEPRVRPQESSSSSGMARLRQMFGARPQEPLLEVEANARLETSPCRPERPREYPQHPGRGLSSYPHLQCPPTFQPESYSLCARLTSTRDEV